MLLASSTWWIVGWSVGVAVVVVAATLLLAIIALARRIVRQAGDIVAALDGTRANTEPLFDLAHVNFSLEQITRGLREATAPEPASEKDSGGLLGKIESGIRSLREDGDEG